MSSSSKSSTSSTQNYTSTTQDNRIAAEAGAVTFSQADGNTINSTTNDNSRTTTVYNALDAGAVGKSFDFAEAISRDAADVSAASVGAVADFSLDALSAVKDSYGDAAASIQSAWKNAGEVSLNGVQSAWKNAGGMMADNTRMTISAITSANKDANAQIANANRDVADAYKGVTDTLSDAWKSSKAGEQKMLAFGVMAIIGLAAAKMLGGR